MDVTNITRRDLVIGEAIYKKDTLTMTLSGTAGSVTDTTTYPVATQATKTEKITIDGGTEQTVTFTDAIDQGYVISNDTFPLVDQDTKTEKVTIDGGSEQTVTYSGATTTAAQVAAQMDAQLTGCSVSVSGTQIVVLSDSKGASSSVAIGTGTSDLVWDTPTTVNSAADIAGQINGQTVGASTAVVGGQVVITSDSTGASSSVTIGTGTADLTWDTPTAGTGKTGAILKGTLLARNTVSKKLTTYSDTGSNGENEPVAVLTFDLTFAASGDKAVRVLKDARVVQELLVKHDDSTAIDTLVIDKLIKNSGIVPVSARDFTVQDNQ